MQKCFYHAKTDAVTMCMGCKMPICATCRDEGRKGFCESCMKKVASLGDQITDTKKTGMVQSLRKATMLKSTGRATGPKNVTYCFHHFDIVASGTCPTCNRAFCPACLNTAGVCSHCARHNPEAQERIFGPNEKGRKILEEVAAEEAKRRWGTKEYVIAGACVLVLIVAWKHFHKPPPKVDTTQETLDRLRENELTPEQKAMLAKLQGQKKVDIQVPVETPLPGAVAETRTTAAVAGATVVGGSRGVAARPVAVSGGARPVAAVPVRVSVRLPGSGATVRGVTPISVGVSGTPGRIDLLVDGEWSGTINSTPYRFDWASQAVGNGPHRLTVQALGEAGVLSQSSVTVTVNN